MISVDGRIFKLDTEKTTYLLEITDFGHLRHIYYGDILKDQNYDSLRRKNNAGYGSLVVYDESDKFYCLDTEIQEYSGIGKGDYRFSPSEIKMPDAAFITDFVYIDHSIVKGALEAEGLPSAYAENGDEETLVIRLKDKKCDVELTLYYAVFPACNVIVRWVSLKNLEENSLEIRRLMSFMLDCDRDDFMLVSFNGGWAREAHRAECNLPEGRSVIESMTGASSNRHNSGVLLKAVAASEDTGYVLGVNLVYSGNHFTSVEKSAHGTLRIMAGIHPHCFSKILKQNEIFTTPQAVLSVSTQGVNGLSHNFHDFINRHIVRGNFKDRERPILINDWEAFMFDFNYRKLAGLANKAAKLGAELFVLDDGWFKRRNDDTAGLGSYETDLKKLPGGLKRLSKKVNRLKMDFGLWFEPEMVNENSALFEAHPEWAVRAEGRKASLGRNQLVLDLCRQEVCDYIVENISKVIREANVKYVKWDMNRHISDMYSAALENQGEFYHRYILGLYGIFGRLTKEFKEVLFESCSSGGNRFDLGMLCFTPQIWASDNTDPVERIDIQGGLSCLYPISTMGVHVSMSPHAQTMRCTELSARFNTACFGNLGYELDLGLLNRAQKKEIKAQIVYYKEHRRTFQYGRFSRSFMKEGRTVWQTTGEGEAVVANFNGKAPSSPATDILPVRDLKGDALYEVETRAQGISVLRFGDLIKHALPVRLKPDGWILRTADKFYRLPDAVEKYRCYGDALSGGIRLNQQFSGTWYNPTVRLLGDFGSSLYTVRQLNIKD